MSIFFSLFTGAFGCVVYGLLIAVFIVATLYFVLMSLNKGIVRTLPFWASMAVLFIALWVNMTVMVGAIRVKSSTTSMEIWLTRELHGMNGVADPESSQAVGELLDRHFPMLGSYINLFNFSGHTFQELPSAIASGIRSEMDSQIWSNILWALGFLLAAVLVSLYFAESEVPAYSRRGRRPGSRTGNHRTLNTSRHGKPHLNRNRGHRL